MKRLSLLTLVLLAVTATPFVAWRLLPEVPIPSFEETRRQFAGSDAELLDRFGETIHQLRVDLRGRRLEWASLEEISPSLLAAVVAAEDRRYFAHRGVDWRAVAAGAAGYLGPGSARGASTLAMQVAAFLVPELSASGRRGLTQKWNQMRAACSLERGWSKHQILEAYLNLVHFRGELQGVSAAAQGIFGKAPHGLDSCESLLLVSLIRAPNARQEAVLRRAAGLREQLHWPVTDAELNEAMGRSVSGSYRIPAQTGIAPHVAGLLLKAAGGTGEAVPLRVQSTLDGRLQRFALEALRQQLMVLKPQNVHDGAVLVVDNQSGEVLAYVGNGTDYSSARYVDGVRARRQAGSTLKPFLYGLAFERQLLTPVSLLDDSPVEIKVSGGLYRPDNYDSRFRGPVSARVALASSLNVPAVRCLGLVGVEAFLDRLKALGFRDLREADFYGPSLALGSADVTLWDLVNAYRTIARGGRWSPLTLRPGTREEGPEVRPVGSPAAAFLVSSILSDRESRSLTFELESPLATRFWSAVKTGTSKDLRDNWCVGFSSRFTTGVWVGNFSGEPMWNVSGITGAAPLWVQVMSWLHRDVPSSAPEPPEGVTLENTTFEAAGGSGQEWFLKGVEERVIEPVVEHGRARIAYPAAGTVLALDPDIPESLQRVFFEGESISEGMRWSLDDQSLGPADRLLPWQPQPGDHTLRLLGPQGTIVDEVNFRVAGH